jgi:hypothetical protein
LPRVIEIWFVACCERLYLFAETGEAAGWVKNIRRNPKVTVRIGKRQIDAMARVLDRNADRLPRRIRENIAHVRYFRRFTEKAFCKVGEF